MLREHWLLAKLYALLQNPGMRLHDYLESGAMTPDQLATKAGIRNVDQVRQWRHGYGGRVPNPANCVAIELATEGKVTRQDLRPDDWQAIWPELAEA